MHDTTTALRSCPARRRARLTAVASAALLTLAAGTLPAAAGTTAAPAPAAAAEAEAAPRLDRQALRASLDAFHHAGMIGAYTAVRDGSAQWRGATGLADLGTGRPTRPDLEHRIGSITKSFTAAAVLQQVGKGRITLDAPIGRYLPELVPGERGRKVTVRMLLNHTSGIADYILPAFPKLASDPGQALDEAQFHRFAPEELVRLGLAATPLKPRGTFAYANTNYVLAGLLLQKVTGQDPRTYITENVIRKAGLRHTYFPRTPRIRGPHARMYESFYGYIDPPRDYSVYDMSWAGVAGALVSTASDVNDFYRQLLSGKLIGAAELREMKKTVPGYETQPGEEARLGYGLGLYKVKLPNGSWFWGHDGGVFGAGTWALSTEDGRRQMTVGYNLMKYERFDENNQPLPNPIGAALVAYVNTAMGGTAAPPVPPRRLMATEPFPVPQRPVDNPHAR
ncbi:hydrolase [Streptomyces spiroverticillatus]|uniref:Hydrolase n=1 Tax=Streptomyces finlayi TaxID=67296 RepID=A0A919C9B5_9ACTN|nr:serine hydrolase domain-containing protein [Streptomyces finlayi]GHA06168.1 hydrolase [Streptomyces spiroverticillatus]GHC89806.1 hydrolase [Streptomyces finlayi]